MTSEIGLVDFLDKHLSEATKAKPSVFLSPAEKYDLIYRWRYNKALSPESLAALRTELAAQEAQIKVVTELGVKSSRWPNVSLLECKPRDSSVDAPSDSRRLDDLDQSDFVA